MVNRSEFPANVTLVMEGMAGTLELNAFPKDEIADFILSDLRDIILPEDGMLYKSGIFALISLTIVALILPLLCCRCCFKKVGVCRKSFDKLLKVGGNLLIKTFQAGFLSFSFSAIDKIVNPNGLAELVVSSVTLYGLLCIVAANFVYL